MPVQLVDGTAGIYRAVFHMFSRASTYTRSGTAASLRTFVRGLRADDLFGSAVQGDVAGQIDVTEFAAKFGAGTTPAKFDRLRTMGRTYTVEEWRGSPNDDAPVFYKLLLRGGSQ